MQFIFIAMMKSAVMVKEAGFDKEFFTKFAVEIWDSMEMNGVEKINDVIDGAMRKDIEPYVQQYLKKRGKNVG